MSYQFQDGKSSTIRACVFIDSSNPELPNQIMNHSSQPFIKPPFPPLIDPKDLLIISKDNKPSRSPNAFIIYRKVFLKTTRDQGYFLPMTIVSSMASKSWDQESDEVRNYYKKLAKDAYKYRTEQFPKKVKRRRKKEPWNTNISFQNDLHNTFFDNSNQTTNPSYSPYIENISNNDISSQNSSPYLEQQIVNENNFNNFQELFSSSPDLSNNSSITSSPEITVNDYPIEYDQIPTNGLLLNQNNFTNFTNFAPVPDLSDYDTYDNYDTTAGLTLYPQFSQFPQCQDVLGININLTGCENEDTFYTIV